MPPAGQDDAGDPTWPISLTCAGQHADPLCQIIASVQQELQERPWCETSIPDAAVCLVLSRQETHAFLVTLFFRLVRFLSEGVSASNMLFLSDVVYV
jgi:hypothetical protein